MGREWGVEGEGRVVDSEGKRGRQWGVVRGKGEEWLIVLKKGGGEWGVVGKKGETVGKKGGDSGGKWGESGG